MVWSLEMRGYRSGERKVRDPGENGENNKNTFGTPYVQGGWGAAANKYANHNNFQCANTLIAQISN